MIDDENITHIEIKHNENIQDKCLTLKNKYNLSHFVTKNLIDYIDNYIKKYNQDKINNNLKRHQTIKRLYYNSIEKLKTKNEFVSKLKENELNNEIKKYSFSPKINSHRSPVAEVMSGLKIEDKLIKNGQLSKEKLKLKKIYSEVKIRETETINSNYIMKHHGINSSSSNERCKYNSKKTIVTEPSNSTLNNHIKSPVKNRILNGNSNKKEELVISSSNHNSKIALKHQILQDKININPFPTAKMNSTRPITCNINYLNYEKNSKSSKNCQNTENFRYGKEEEKEIKNRVNTIKICPRSKNMSLQNKKTNYQSINRFISPNKSENLQNSEKNESKVNKKLLKTTHSVVKKINSNNLQKLNISSILNSNGSRSNKNFLTEDFDIKYLGNNEYPRNLIDLIESEQSKEDLLKKVSSEKLSENLTKFKLENLKEIYNILNRNHESIESGNFEHIDLPNHVIEKLVQPVCYIMKSREIEFNFQNFFLISDEIINFIFE